VISVADAILIAVAVAAVALAINSAIWHRVVRHASGVAHAAGWYEAMRHAEADAKALGNTEQIAAAERQRLLSLPLDHEGRTIASYAGPGRHPEDRWARGYQCAMYQVAALLADVAPGDGAEAEAVGQAGGSTP
jgi:hypothetical protein